MVLSGNSLFNQKSQNLRWKDNEKHHCCILMFASGRCRAPEFGSSEAAEHVHSLGLLRAQVIPSSSVNYLAGLLTPTPTKQTIFNSKSQLWKLHPNCASKLDINQLISSSGPLLVSASSAPGSEYFLIYIVPSGLTSPCSPLYLGRAVNCSRNAHISLSHIELLSLSDSLWSLARLLWPYPCLSHLESTTKTQ